jgi:hypothetical protein
LYSLPPRFHTPLPAIDGVRRVVIADDQLNPSLSKHDALLVLLFQLLLVLAWLHRCASSTLLLFLSAKKRSAG